MRESDERTTRRSRQGLAAALLAAVVLLSGCGGAEEDASTRALRFAYIPGEEDPEGRMAAFGALADYLSEQIGREVDLIKTVSYAPTIEAMRAGKIDFMRAGGSFTYMIAHEKAGAEAVARVGTSAGPGLYQSAIVTHPGSGITTIEELRERAADIDFAFVDPASTSGHLIPRAHLEASGIDADADFGRTLYTMSHTNSVMTIIAGKVDAGAISLNSYERLLERDMIDPDAIVFLWVSEPIPTAPIMVRPDLPEELKHAIRDAYLSLNDGKAAVYPALQEVYRVDDLTFWAAQDDEWDPLRTVARNIESFDLLPGAR